MLSTTLWTKELLLNKTILMKELIKIVLKMEELSKSRNAMMFHQVIVTL